MFGRVEATCLLLLTCTSTQPPFRHGEIGRLTTRQALLAPLPPKATSAVRLLSLVSAPRPLPETGLLLMRNARSRFEQGCFARRPRQAL